MTDRLTSAWTKTAEEAFGNSGKMGREGELTVLKEVESWGWEVEDHEEDKALQVQGIDISIKKPTWNRFYTVDVKTGKSYLSEYGVMKVDITPNGWLFSEKKTSDRIWHLNVETGWMAWYDRQDMKKHIESIKETLDPSATYYSFNPSNKQPFIFRAKIKHE